MENQLLLFPELDPYLTKIKNVDYVDVADIKCGEKKQTSYNVLPKGLYILFKSGGINRYHEEMGNVFPYIQNTKTLHILSVCATKYIGYCRSTINFGKNQGLFINWHRIVCEAFVENDMPDIKNNVDHINGDSLDYRVKNLRWVTSSQNSMGVKRKRQVTFFDQARMDEVKKK